MSRQPSPGDEPLRPPCGHHERDDHHAAFLHQRNPHLAGRPATCPRCLQPVWAILTPGMGRCWHGWPTHPCKYEEYAVEPHKAPINYRGPVATYTEGLWWKYNPQPAGYGVCAHAIHQCPGLHRDAPGTQDSLF